MSDLISRQAAIDALNVLCQEHRYKIPGKRETYSQYNEAWQDALDKAEGAIFNLPPVPPKRGYWTELHEHIYMGNVVKEWTNLYCSECDAPNDKPTDFCPNCGADMRCSENPNS